MKLPKTSWNKFTPAKISKKTIGKRWRRIEKGSLRHAHKFVISRLDRLAGVSRHISSWLFLVILLIGVSMLQSFNHSQAYVIESVDVGGSYSEGVTGPLETLNPIFATSSAELSAAKLMFASLYTYDSSGNIKGDLAEYMSVNDKETEYTVRIRPDAKWSDGQKITASDVEFTAKLLANPETKSKISGWSFVKSEKVDDHTIKFALSSPYAPFIHALTFPILPEHTLKDIKPEMLQSHDFSSNPVTSGPFNFRMVQNINPDGSKKVLYLLANKEYHRGAPKLERFQLYAYSSSDDIVKGLRTKEITATPELEFNKQAREIQINHTSSVHAINNGVYALFNNNSQYLSKKSIRQALSLAVDMKKLRRDLDLGDSPLNGPVLDRFLSKPSTVGGYNLKKAKELLNNDGWSIVNGVRQKDKQKMTLKLLVLEGEVYEKVANKLADLWRNDLGIEIELRVVNPSDVSQNILQSVLQPRNFDILIYEFQLGGDPDMYAYWHSSQANPNGLNFANYNNAVADDALASGRLRLSDKQRTSRYDKFSSIWQADYPALAIYQAKIDYIYLNSVNALAPGDKLVNPADRFYNIIYWTVNKNSVYKTP